MLIYLQALDSYIGKLCKQEGEPNIDYCLMALEARPIKGSQFYNKYIQDKIDSGNDVNWPIWPIYVNTTWFDLWVK